MTTLHRYLLLQSLYYLFLCLMTCIGIYLLVDVFDRLDNFLEDQAGLKTTLTYFLVKIPLIVSEILPAVFFLALLVQLSQMSRQRELIALESSGISYFRLVVFFVIYALCWCCVQFFFSQWLGVAGEAKSEQIWDHLGRKTVQHERVISDVWFRQGNKLVHVDRLYPDKGRGRGIEIFQLQDGFTRIEAFVEAGRFEVKPQGWRLYAVKRFQPSTFSTQHQKTWTLPVKQRLDVFEDVKNPEKMPLWRLGGVIERLQASGTNVEFLRTAWHSKIAYAFSILVLACIGLILARQRDNIFLNIAIGLGVIFVYFFIHVIGGTLGENGIVPPYAGAWLANALVGGPAVFQLVRTELTK